MYQRILYIYVRFYFQENRNDCNLPEIGVKSNIPITVGNEFPMELIDEVKDMSLQGGAPCTGNNIPHYDDADRDDDEKRETRVTLNGLPASGNVITAVQPY